MSTDEALGSVPSIALCGGLACNFSTGRRKQENQRVKPSLVAWKLRHQPEPKTCLQTERPTKTRERVQFGKVFGFGSHLFILCVSMIYHAHGMVGRQVVIIRSLFLPFDFWGLDAGHQART